MKQLKLGVALTLLLVSPVIHSYAQMSMTDHIHRGSTCVIVQHNVANFDTWYVAYAKDEARREKAGIEEKLVLRGVENPNRITVVFALNDLKKAKAFFADPHTAELMQAAGVTSKPDFTYFKVNNSGNPKGESFLIVRHTVRDYDYWKKAFDKHQKVRAAYKISLTALGKDLANPLNVVAIFNSDNSNNIKSFLEKSDLKEVMKNAGVTSKPIEEIMVFAKK